MCFLSQTNKGMLCTEIMAVVGFIRYRQTNRQAMWTKFRVFSVKPWRERVEDSEYLT